MRDLVELLHQGASADDFARRLALVDALPPDDPDKSALVETVRMAMAVRNRLELHQERERGLLAVIESAQDLSSRLDLQGLLKRHRLARAQPAGLGHRVAVDLRRRRRRVPRAGRRRRAVAEDVGHGGAPRPRRGQHRDVDAAAVHDARLPARHALRARRQARRHLPRGRHRRAGRRAADLGRRGRSGCCSSPTATTARTPRRASRSCARWPRTAPWR